MLQTPQAQAGWLSGRPGLRRLGRGWRSCGKACRAGRLLGSGTRARWPPQLWGGAVLLYAAFAERRAVGLGFRRWVVLPDI